MRIIEKIFESLLWNSRFVVLFAVIASMVAAFAVFFIVTFDVVGIAQHALHYVDASLSVAERSEIRGLIVTHVVEVVDGYLLATVMLIFSLGLYELFISDIDHARGKQMASRILVIESLDDLKNRLAKVILMILIVRIFEQAVQLKIATAMDLLLLSGAAALIGLALYLSHMAESHGGDTKPEKRKAAKPPERPDSKPLNDH